MAALLSALSLAARTAIPIIRRGVREGLSANQIGRALSTGGMGVRRQTLFQLVQAERVAIAAGHQFRFLGKNVLPNRLNIPQALGKLRRQYSYTVDLRGPTWAKDRKDVQQVTVVSDVLLTPAQAEESASQMGVAGKDRYNREISQVVLVGIRQAGGEGLWT